ncbi:hypothetical protein [Thiohalophilus sp.]|uniref:hypothetical protein n=1 Tax=Thiohalophilus sp. TaxID=3028392 RepID=UPI002ACE67EF|nr:hypothetical protein [Thiohalophilus sp.]MDZ7803872.1 hypothetical protein [Thiohalophilus sp.]
MFALIQRALLIGLMLSFSLTASAAELKPFSLAGIADSEMSRVVSDVQGRLERGGFEIIGTYRPYDGAHIFAVTSERLKNVARQSDYGGFGAVIKVAVTEVANQQGGKQIQVSYNNPEYIGLAYNMGSRLAQVKRRLGQAIGFDRDFGGDGIDEDKLPSYNYTFGLEDFYGFFDFVDHGSHAQAVRKVERGLATNNFGIGQVYKLKVPGKQQVVYGLSLQADVEEQKFLNDKFVMDVIDHQPLRRTAHLPYEIMVNGSKVIALHPHFRLAVMFPDLRMFGEHSFGRLMDLPYVYEEFFTQAVGGQWPPGGDSW